MYMISYMCIYICLYIFIYKGASSPLLRSLLMTLLEDYFARDMKQHLFHHHSMIFSMTTEILDASQSIFWTKAYFNSFQTSRDKDKPKGFLALLFPIKYDMIFL